MATNVPSPTFGPQGFLPADETSILNGVMQDMNVAFGGNLNTNLETPQGQLAASKAAIISNAQQVFCFYTNQVDPNYAVGRMQDAIGRIYFLDRFPAKATVVTAVCTGASGVIIPVGTLAQAADGNIYTCTDGGTISSFGTVTLTFECNTVGPIACPAGTLNKIYRAILGWDSITNPTDGVIGNSTETRYAFEERRKQSVAQNAKGFLPSILGSVLSIDGVLDAYTTENPTNGTVVIGGKSLTAHSLYVAVVGGTDEAVAEAIWSKKSPGCDYIGNTTVTIEDNNPLLSPPYPTYDVKFERPVSLPVIFQVTIADSTLVPSNAAALIQEALISAFAGEDGGPRARIGGIIYASRFYAAVAKLGVWAQIVYLKIGSTNAASAAFTADIAGTLMTVSAVASGTLAVGQTVIGADVLDGTKIASLGTGAGGTGTYNLNKTQTVVSETMKSALANVDSVTVQIDQVPTISSDNITVTLV